MPKIPHTIILTDGAVTLRKYKEEDAEPIFDAVMYSLIPDDLRNSK